MESYIYIAGGLTANKLKLAARRTALLIIDAVEEVRSINLRVL